MHQNILFNQNSNPNWIKSNFAYFIIGSKVEDNEMVISKCIDFIIMILLVKLQNW